MKAAPWHAEKPGDKLVFHDNTDCPEGKTLESNHKRAGHANRPPLLIQPLRIAGSVVEWCPV
jgi:hypothetical protein